MSPESLLRQFDVLAEAPNGIAKLRELILQLAVRGKLVPQDPSDEQVSLLLDRIARERDRLHAEGTVRKAKQLTPVTEAEWPYRLPDSWRWIRLGASTPYPLTDGDWVESKDQDPGGDIRLVQLADVGEGNYRNKSTRFLTSSTATRLNCTYLEPCDVLIARLPNPLGRACIFPGDPKPCVTVVDVAIARCGSNGMSARYIMHSINSATLRNQMYAYGTGTTRFRISTGNIVTLLLPVPPLQEQDRIVAKVDELMARCDELELRQQRRAAAKTRLNRSALHHLTTASDDTEFAIRWQGLQTSFGQLYDTPEAVAELRQAVLQLAVQGKLVPQDPADEPASMLLEQITVERERRSPETMADAAKALSPIAEQELPHKLPKGWEWVRLGTLGHFMGGGTPSKADPSLWNGDIPWVSPKDMKVLRLANSVDHISAEAIARSAVRLIPAGALLMVVRGMILARAFPVALAECDVTVNQDMKALVPYCLASNVYLLLALRAAEPTALRAIERSTHGTCRLSFDRLEGLLLPIPPLAEQRRIVTKVDELMTLCDLLEPDLNTARSKSASLAASVVHHFTAA